MIAVDSNVLVYAHRTETRLHDKALEKLTALAEGDAPWGAPTFVLAEFVRVVTHARIFTPPTSLDVAFAFISQLLDSPSVRLLLPGPAFPALLEQCCLAADARGNLVFDAQIAAVCREHGVAEVLTADRDFSRFADLRPQFL